jgi:hypothetical protein
MVENETHDGRNGHDCLRDQAGRQVDGPHEDAHGGDPEERARELEPLRPGEAGLDLARGGLGERNAYQTLVPPSHQQDERAGRRAKLLEPVVELLERPLVAGDGPDSVAARDAHGVI